MNPATVDISWIAECLKEQKLTANFSDSQIRRIAAFAVPMAEKAPMQKLPAEPDDCGRATLGRFISVGKWERMLV
ncbi:MAG: hypothetical protein LBU32_31145 [Clostridiales bacterium]|jgi:hypothetical protein|nr:hypothetical protein [Clostridiales bacterium]